MPGYPRLPHPTEPALGTVAHKVTTRPFFVNDETTVMGHEAFDRAQRPRSRMGEYRELVGTSVLDMHVLAYLQELSIQAHFAFDVRLRVVAVQHNEDVFRMRPLYSIADRVHDRLISRAPYQELDPRMLEIGQRLDVDREHASTTHEVKYRRHVEG